MTANLMAMHSHAGFPYHEPDMDHHRHHHMAADMSNFYGDPDSWLPAAGFAPAEMPFPDARFNLNSSFRQDGAFGPANKPSRAMVQHDYANCVSRPETSLTINTSQHYPSPSVFTPTNAIVDPQKVASISPTGTHFDQDDNLSTSSTASYPSGHRLSLSPSDTLPFSTMPQEGLCKRRRDSQQAMTEKSSPRASHASQSARRRRYEYAEPGSARAVYLEKNRKAASKCRSKQKMQQEELVETARDVERRNKTLKAEVEFLRSGMRDLMDIVGQHTACPDSRLRTYVQREADRLASDRTRTT